MRRFAETVLKWRVVIIVLTVIITVVFGFGMTKLTINSDFTSYLKPSDPAMKLFNRIGDEYGGSHILMVAVRSGDIVTYPSLLFIKDLTDLYEEIEGVSTVTSLLNIIDIRDAGYGLEVGKLIDENAIPEDDTELSSLREYILSNDTYSGKIISPDGSTTLIICKLDPDFNKIDVARELLGGTEAKRGDYEVFYSGFPVQMTELSRFIAKDIMTLIPIVFVVILVVLFFSFRTARGVLCPLMIVVVSTIWTMGLLGFTNTPLTVLSDIIPVILLALGTAYGIHFLSRYYEDVSDEHAKLQEIMTTIRHIGIPILLTALTTIAGFLSFTGAYITAISDFGIFTAIGIFFAMILSLTFLPAVLSFLKVKPIVLAKKEKEHVLKKLMHRTSGLVFGSEKKILIIGLGIALLCLAVIPRIKPETAIINFFPKRSEIRKADAVIQDTFGGSTTITIALKGDIKSPHVLKEMLLLEKYLDHLPQVQNSQSLADLIARMNDTLNGHRTVPQTKEEVANLMFLLEGEEMLKQMVNPDYSEAIIQATFGSLDAGAIKGTIESIERYIDEHITGTRTAVTADSTGSADLREWQFDRLSRAIYYDTNARYPETSQAPEEIKKAVASAIGQDDGTRVLLSDEMKEKLRANLLVFFEEESEVYIESPTDIEKTVDALLIYAGETTAAVSDIEALLEENIPDKYYADYPEALSYTAEFVYAKLENAQNESWIESIAVSLIDTLFAARTDDPGFKKMIKDDLWILTENTPLLSAPHDMGSADSKPADSETVTMDASLSGMIRIVQRLNESLVKSQVQSIIIAIIVVFLMLSVQFRSVRMGAVVLSPIVLIILVNFALMGFFGLPLDYATMLVGSIMIGVGIDYSIHFSSRFRIEYKASHDERKALERTLKTTGIAVFSNALMVALGFFVLVGGKFIPVRREGWMIGTLMFLSAFAALVFLPSFIITTKKWLRLNNNHTNRRKK
ncbi:MAG: MMPL family transporter [Spirochaetes bacterium]|nr:MMPL family transporter [Spirochaetota bacterium]